MSYWDGHVISTVTEISFLTGIASGFGGSILKSDTVVGIVPLIWIAFSLLGGLNWNLFCNVRPVRQTG
jgi:hypothetical protein